jgi:STE24 endopeptidase
MPYATLLVAALLLEYAVEMVGDALNLRALRPEVPARFSGVYDPERYARSQAYARAKARFAGLPRTVSLAVLLAFWWYGGFESLDVAVRALGLGVVLTGAVYIGALVVLQELLSLPFSWYSTFVIEERFGFNRTTPATFVLDRVKGLALLMVIGGPALSAVLWLLERAGDTAWLWGLAVTTVWLLGLQFVAPTWLMPIFNTFRPLEEGELARAVRACAARAGFPLEGLYVVDGSRRSTKANAFLAGFGSRKRIALFDTLVARHPADEIVSIVAHEIGHHKKGHVLQGAAIGIAQLAVIFFLLGYVLHDPNLFSSFHVSRPSVHVGLVLFAIMYAPVGLALSLVVQAHERRCELEADAFARDTLGSGDALVRALEKLSAESLANLTPHPFYVWLHHSHPPLADRVAALQA